MPTEFQLREVLDKLSISQAELSRRSGVSVVTINAIATNRTKQVALSTLDKIATALGVQPGDLIVKRRSRKR